MERARAWAEAKEKEKTDIDRVYVKVREWARAEAKARVRDKSNTFQRAAVDARRGKGRNPMLQGGWQYRLPPRSGPVPISREQRERGWRMRQGPRLRLRLRLR